MLPTSSKRLFAVCEPVLWACQPMNLDVPTPLASAQQQWGECPPSEDTMGGTSTANITCALSKAWCQGLWKMHAEDVALVLQDGPRVCKA